MFNTTIQKGIFLTKFYKAGVFHGNENAVLCTEIHYLGAFSSGYNETTVTIFFIFFNSRCKMGF